jgi:mRNA interferase MazF
VYVPDRGDVVWLSFDPQVGREQAGRRPALVLSPKAYNGKVGLILCCPITNRAKGYPFEVPIPDEAEVTGVILSDHVRSLDWRGREARQITRLPAQTLNEVLARIEALLRD